MGRNFWRYQIILLLLFFLWGGFFTSGTILNQIGFNFAVFYPVGLYAGYRMDPHGVSELYAAAVVFNAFTYGLAYASGGLEALPNLVLIGIDFLSMAIVAGIGFAMGRRMRS